MLWKESNFHCIFLKYINEKAIFLSVLSYICNHFLPTGIFINTRSVWEHFLKIHNLKHFTSPRTAVSCKLIWINKIQKASTSTKPKFRKFFGNIDGTKPRDEVTSMHKSRRLSEVLNFYTSMISRDFFCLFVSKYLEYCPPLNTSPFFSKNLVIISK